MLSWIDTIMQTDSQACAWLVLLLALIAAVCLYRLLPVLACRLDRQAAMACAGRRLSSDQHRRRRNPHRWLTVWREKRRTRLIHAGLASPAAEKLYGFVLPGLPILILSCGLVSGQGLLQPAAGSLLLAALVRWTLDRRIAERRNAFTRSLYKIYRFLDGQVSSGVAVTDALRGLPEVVRDPLVRPALVRFAAVFEVTLDSEQAFSVIHRLFGGPDCDQMAAHIRQCLQSGVAGKSMVRMEELLFTRTFSLLQEETRRIRASLAWTVAFALVPVIILFLYPLLHGTLSAMQSIFG